MRPRAGASSSRAAVAAIPVVLAACILGVLTVADHRRAHPSTTTPRHPGPDGAGGDTSNTSGDAGADHAAADASSEHPGDGGPGVDASVDSSDAGPLPDGYTQCPGTSVQCQAAGVGECCDTIYGTIAADGGYVYDLTLAVCEAVGGANCGSLEQVGGSFTENFPQTCSTVADCTTGTVCCVAFMQGGIAPRTGHQLPIHVPVARPHHLPDHRRLCGGSHLQARDGLDPVARVREVLPVRASIATLLALTLLASSATARAQDATRERERAALYQQGVDLAAAGNWAQAVERFKRVVELRASTKALYTLGEAEEHAGQLAAAKRSYRASLDSARAGAAKDIVDLAGAALGKLEGRVPQVTVRLDERTAAHGGDTRASIDGHGAPIGAASDVDPGDHEVRVEATGAAPFVRTVHAVGEGQQLDVTATLEWSAVAPAVAPSLPRR